MAADLSDPALVSAVNSISDPVSPISWLALGYHPTAEKTLILLSTGFDPWVPRWQELMATRRADPLFGYGVVAKGRPMRDGGEKGVVLVYLPEVVTGVRRARAVVHSRALANKFPDYSAILTISDPSEITEEFVRDQVNFYNQPVPTPTSSPVKPRTPAQLGIGLGLGRPSAPIPAAAEKSHGDRVPSSTLRAIQPSSSSSRSFDRPLPPPPAAPLDLPDNPRLSTPTPPRLATPPPRARLASDSMPKEHCRKDSLSSRFAKALPSLKKSSKGDESGSEANSPKSASRFAAFTSGFGTGSGRKDSDHNVSVVEDEDPAVRKDQAGTSANSGVAKPADVFGATSTASRGEVIDLNDPPAGATDTMSRDGRPYEAAPLHTAAFPDVDPAHGSHYSDDRSRPGMLPSRSSSSIGSNSIPPPLPPKQGNPTPPSFNRLHTLGAIIPHSSETTPRSSSLPSTDLGPSSSHSPFLMSPTASAALSSAREKQVNEETRVHDEFRRTEEERTRIRVNSGNRTAGIVRTPTPMLHNDDYDDDEGLPYDRPDADEAKQGNLAGSESVSARSASVDASQPLESSAAANSPREVTTERELEDETLRAASEAERIREEEEASRLAELREAERQSEMKRVRALEEQIRKKEEEDARLRREEEEARMLHLAQEQEKASAMRAAEEDARLRAKIQAEAEARAEAMEAESERVKKQEEIKENLRKGKENGGVMLSGHVTVQTTKSVTWRRRHFQLLPTELKLFKTETDISPIQTISLAHGTKVSQTYEESQVQGSFMISSIGVDGSDEAFFLFTDSAEEKEVLLHGLSIAVGQ